MKPLILLLFVSSCWSVSSASTPVLLWTSKMIGSGNVESNLNEFSPKQFADVLAWKSEQGNIPIVAFGLDSFSLEDLTPQSPGTPEPFRKLRRITDASAETLLYPSVESAGDAISILHKKGFLVHQINAGDPLPKFESPNTILVINEQPSVNMDDEILRVYSHYTLEYPNIVGMLWGQHSTWTEEPDDLENEIVARSKRQAPPTTQPPSASLFSFNDDKGLLVVFREVVLTVISNKDQRPKLNYTKATGSTTGNASMTELTLTFGPATGNGVSVSQFDLKLKLEKDTMGYYSMTNMTATIVGKDTESFSDTNVRLSSGIQLSAPNTDSFHCSRFGSWYPTFKQENRTFNIDIKGFQIQAFQPASSTQFAPAYECVGFFTPGIWSGIFVTIILIGILSWGMKMIMDVKTMDRFDDPKGKPISFGSGD